MIINNTLFSLRTYGICPECGGKMKQVPCGDQCTECNYSYYYCRK